MLLFLFFNRTNISLKIEKVSCVYVYFHWTLLMYSYLSQYLFIETRMNRITPRVSFLFFSPWSSGCFCWLRILDSIVSSLFRHRERCYACVNGKEKLHPLRSTHIISHKTEKKWFSVLIGEENDKDSCLTHLNKWHHWSR